MASTAQTKRARTSSGRPLNLSEISVCDIDSDRSLSV
jgi:hypothetical protein